MGEKKEKKSDLTNHTSRALCFERSASPRFKQPRRWQCLWTKHFISILTFINHMSVATKGCLSTTGVYISLVTRLLFTDPDFPLKDGTQKTKRKWILLSYYLMYIFIRLTKSCSSTKGNLLDQWQQVVLQGTNLTSKRLFKYFHISMR